MQGIRLLLPAALLALATTAAGADLPKVEKVDHQPLGQQALRVAQALELLGEPLPEGELAALKKAAEDEKGGVAAIQEILDRRCLFGLHVPAREEGKARTLRVESGPAKPALAELGWRVFLVKVYNPTELSGVTLRATSPNALPLTQRSSGSADPKGQIPGEEVKKRFLDLLTYNQQPLVARLSGLEVEYRVLQLYSRDPGKKEAAIGFQLLTGDRPVASAPPAKVTFDVSRAVPVVLEVIDHDLKTMRDGQPVMASFTFTDEQGRVYPSPSRRLAPDFNFHYQVYRGTGEKILLQPGTYTVSYTRGPEYLVLTKKVTVEDAPAGREPQKLSFKLERWTHPAARGWYSGDHHIHAAGCAHYESPTKGVDPEDMMRHVLGEDLNVGCCLSWGPCWYHQKTFFEGKVHKLSTPDHLLRYDVEVSGFPSSHCGHICLLRLREDDYPGTTLHTEWPSWDLPIFKWAKSQGGVVGFAHSGWGLNVDSEELPNYLVPPMNGIGANEYIVDVVHGMCDFISTVDTPSVYELNIWYHTLNCGYRCRISGETDFPCIYGQRVGLGRSYVHLEGKLDFDAWCEGIKTGRCYVSDGKSHLMDFTVNDQPVGVKGSEVKLDKAAKITVKADVAAYLDPEPGEEAKAIRKRPLNQKPYWDIERCRIGDGRKVPVELVVNGQPVARQEIVADGKTRPVTFTAEVEKSSWVCLRILPSSHTNPVFVTVGDKPIRASKRSAEWCIKAVDQCWKEKVKQIREKERQDAKKAFDEARAAYEKVLAESEGG